MGAEGALILFQNASGSAVSTWTSSNPGAAAAYVANMAENDERNAAKYLLALSMGSSETISGVRNEALRLAMERWLANSEDEETFPEIIDGERYRGDGRRNRDDLISERQTICSCSQFYTVDSWVAVPEPPAMLLAALGSFGLLRRRRTA